MNYRLKLLCTWILEFLPFRDSIHFFIQKNITRSLSIDKKYIKICDAIAKKHLKNFQKFNGNDSIFLLDFGSGWRLVYPLIMTKYCEKVVASDIKNNARKEINIQIENCLQIPLEKIDYITPCDISKTNFDDKSFNLITSNSVLEHIPRELIPKVASECYRLLTDNGICSFHIAHQDHWSHNDSNLEKMNYLKFSEFKWKFLNPPLNFQNRMLQSEYIKIFEEVGFKYKVTSKKVNHNIKVDQYF